MKRLFYIAIILLVSAIWFGCSTTKYIPLESVRYDTTYVNKYQYDSIYKRDSIVVRDKGDTVFIEKYRYLYRDKLLRDTLYFSKTDSIHVPYPVERELTVWQEFRLKWFNALVAVSLGLLVWTFRTPLKNLIRRFI